MQLQVNTISFQRDADTMVRITFKDTDRSRAADSVSILCIVCSDEIKYRSGSVLSTFHISERPLR